MQQDAIKTPAISPAQAAASAASFAALEASLDYLSETEIDQVRRAYRFADTAHLGQMRKNGDPYITHPMRSARSWLWMRPSRCRISRICRS